MPHRTTRRKSHRLTQRKSIPFSQRPTIKEHGFRIVRHTAPSMGKRRSMKNIHRSVKNLIREENIERPVYNWSTKQNKPKSGRIENDLLRQRKKLEKQREKNEREERRSQKASKAAAASNLDDMMSRMQL